MDISKLKKFSQFARRALVEQVDARLGLVLMAGASERREHPNAMKKLDAAIDKHSKGEVIERVAYIWFNRLSALRYMDLNNLNAIRVVSPVPGQFQPEILVEAKAGNISADIVPEKTRKRVFALLDGRVPSPDSQSEAYRLLLVAVCNYWQKSMPFLFERIDDYTELLLPEDLLSPASILAYLREAMTPNACEDVEIVGWLYQFYISERKDQVFADLKKNVKIEAENIPAATQLFTPHWIVRYLVENSLGRLWLLNNPASGLAAKMDYYIAPEEPETDFLRITRPEEIRICDPAAGSGHMLTYAFELLYAIYEEEGYDATEIPALILTHNLTGVEIDDRAGALAAFALAMKAAAKLGRRRFLRMEAKPDICVLQNVSFTPAEMQDVAAVVGKDLFTDELRETLRQFEQAKNFGSLIVPKLHDPAETLRIVEARDFGGDLLLKEVQERVIGVLRMAEALTPKYHVVVANPPYMGRGGMNPTLMTWTEANYSDSKSDLFAMFMVRSLMLNVQGGFMAMINMQSWMFLSSFEKMRGWLLASSHLTSMAHLGERAFDTIGGSVVSTTAFVFEKSRKASSAGYFVRLIDGRNENEKLEALKRAASGADDEVYKASTTEFERIPGYPIAYWISQDVADAFLEDMLSSVGSTRRGLQTGNKDLFIRQWSEVGSEQTDFVSRNRVEALQRSEKWFRFNNGGDYRKWAGGIDLVVNWQSDGRDIKATGKAIIPSEDLYFKEAVCWGRISSGPEAYRLHEGGLLPGDLSPCFFSDAPYFSLAYFNSPVARTFKNVVNPTITNTVGDLAKIPAPTRATQQNASVERVVRQLVASHTTDWDSYETSWDFTTLPLLSPDHRGETLEVSYATLRAHWQSITDEMQRLEEENNRIFIDAYGLQDELPPEVPLNEITLTCNPAYRYGIKNDAEANETRLRADTMAEFLSYAVGCMFGRYSLDAPGLILANQGETLADYLATLKEKGVPEPTFMPDEDNVIPVLDENWFPDDITERFHLFLRVTFGEAHFRENLKFIEDTLGKNGKPRSLRDYFTKDFYADHVKRYKKRPIYWMFSSPKGTFNALIYMHRYRADTVSVLLNDYLREFITKLEGERTKQEKLAYDPTATQGQKTKALKEAAKVAKQIDELNEWERDVIFPLAQKKIEIDLDDGVKANYPKFDAALKKIVGLSK
ncbi:type II restriction/modification system DNA methylase subunit YeeA [Pacificibacter maritimus]|uniref:site-specific DNA-methyltransferase (adenine-specific) n=1 Tax=Pacificibacter maritimus TaxID=762213 RepID=A0A3N4UA38_9RHOB|nr:BREX-1 system adenine-specific DNA-methyltransferase PglX [Pacificibacter maritimus]RPE67322.1 type II restriction/modification system DNA methylase subunit YeeA [Pacificibacter maritimus]